MNRERRFMFTWTRTQDNQPHDFSAFDGDLRIGRVYRILGEPSGRRWRWTMTAKIGNRVGTGGNLVDGRDEACRQVEQSYRDFREWIAKD
jgi:hypothetical protein